jgi:hypothetical protein
MRYEKKQVKVCGIAGRIGIGNFQRIDSQSWRAQQIPSLYAARSVDGRFDFVVCIL